VMCPNKESLYCNSSHSVYHSNISKYRFTRKKAQNMRYNTKSWLNLHIHFWMSKKPN
jgi:hypothetical protein